MAEPRVLWFTGLSGAGKTTIATALLARLHGAGRGAYLIDGDVLRRGLSADLGFSDADRTENIRRAAHVAAMIADAGMVALVALISPFRAERALARALVPPGCFVEIFVDTPLAVAEARDVKGLYARARAGMIPHFTGISSPYEPPEVPDIRIDTARESAEQAAERLAALVLGARPSA